MRVVALVFVALVAGNDVTASPIGRVVELIEGLKSKIQADGKAEQQVYDKYACWCEKTTARKAAAIEDAKVKIEELSKNILTLNGRLGSYGAEIQKLNKDIVENKESTATSEEMRKTEHEEYVKSKAALEQAVANLEKAIKTLTAGTSGFTPAMVETRMLTVAAGVRGAMHLYANKDAEDMQFNKDGMDTVKSFLANPAALLSTKANPATGTYNTQSGAIQGILSEMYEQFQRDLVSQQEEEDQKQADFEELHATKMADLNLLENTLTKKTLEQGEDTKQLAEDSQDRKETDTQLKTDEAFFTTAKENCKQKADNWAERSRLRTEELAGINQALAILTSPESKATFESSDSTFVQLSVQQMGAGRTSAFNILKKTATKTNSLRLAALASTLYTSGHFDAVIVDINKMIAALREEEKADIAHKDWCETQQKSAASKNENLEYDKDQLSKKIQRAEGAKAGLQDEITKTETEMSDQEAAMQENLDNRNAEHEQFQQAAKDDSDAVMLIGKAIEALSAFAKNNDLALVKVHQEPEYKGNPDTAPEEVGGGKAYGGRSSEGGGIVMILEMIKEDIEKEMKTSSKEEGDADAAFRKQRAESTECMDAFKAKVVSLGEAVAGKMKEISEASTVLGDKEASKTATDDFLTELKPNCDWIGRTYDSRMDQRKAEMDGLENAKNVLAGAGGDAEKGSLMVTRAQLAGKTPTVDDKLKDLDSLESSFGFTSFLQRS